MNIPYKQAQRILAENRARLESLPRVVRVSGHLGHCRNRWLIEVVVDDDTNKIDFQGYPWQIDEVDITYVPDLYPTADDSLVAVSISL